jgi:hypothetical protein
MKILSVLDGTIHFFSFSFGERQGRERGAGGWGVIAHNVRHSFHQGTLKFCISLENNGLVYQNYTFLKPLISNSKHFSEKLFTLSYIFRENNYLIFQVQRLT